MNCKQGDLAIIVRSVAGNEGKIVRCLRLSCHSSMLAPDGLLEEGAIWEIDQDLVGWGGTSSAHVFDSQLRPIDNPGRDEVDEMVKRVGKPEAREVAA